MSLFLRSFLILAVMAYAVGALGALFLDFGTWFRMPEYQYQYPFRYVAVVAVPYGFLAALWVTFLGHYQGVRKWLSLCGVIAGTLFISSPLGGLLWTYHDMLAGFFPPWPQMVNDLEHNAINGWLWGPILVLLSFPINVVALVVGLTAPIWLRKRLKK